MKKCISIIKNGGVAVIKTDTLYGIVGSAHNQHAVDKIYKIKGRSLLKPVIVLISDISDVQKLGIDISVDFIKITENHWPGKVSIVIPIPETIDLHYLHKGTGGVAFRVPADADLRKFLKETGPIIAPSANHEGNEPAKNIREAMAYFTDEVDYYLDGGECTNTQASKIIKISENGEVEIIRK